MDVSIYRFGNPMSQAAVAGLVGAENLDEFLAASLARKPVTRSFDIRPVLGRRFEDVIWTGISPVVSEKAVSVLTEAELRGWTTFPVTVYDKQGGVVPGYSGLRITGRSSAISLDRNVSQVVYIESPGGSIPHYRGLYYDRPSWDGSDLFTGERSDTAWILATSRVRDAFRQHGITNCEFTPIEDVELLAHDLMKEQRGARTNVTTQ